MRNIRIDSRGKMSVDGIEGTPCLLYADSNLGILYVFTGSQPIDFADIEDTPFQFKTLEERMRERALFSQSYSTQLTNGRINTSRRILQRGGISLGSDLEVVPSAYLSFRKKENSPARI